MGNLAGYAGFKMDDMRLFVVGGRVCPGGARSPRGMLLMIPLCPAARLFRLRAFVPAARVCPGRRGKQKSAPPL